MISKNLLSVVRPRPSDTEGLVYAGGIERDGMILAGEARSPATGETYQIRDGYLDLLKSRTGADSLANLTNFLPGAGRGYEPLWRVRSISLLTGEPFSNERELEIIKRLVRPVRGGRYLDLGCSAGLYTRSLSSNLDSSVGIDISPSMLREADRRARGNGVNPSFVRANAKHLPFFDASFAGAVCGGSPPWACCVQAPRVDAGSSAYSLQAASGFSTPTSYRACSTTRASSQTRSRHTVPSSSRGLPDGVDTALYKASTVSGVGSAPWAPASVTAAAPARTA